MALAFRKHLEWLIGAAAAAGAAELAVLGRPLTAFDQALPLLAAVAVLAGWLARESRLAGFVCSAPPLLLVACIAIPDGQLRLVAYGVIVAAALLGAAAAISRGASLPLSGSVILVGAVLAVLRVPGPDGPPLVPLFAIFAGAALLLVVLSEEGEVAAAAVALVAGAAIATPLVPSRAALFPLLAALVAWSLASRGAVRWVLALFIAVAAGRWAIPIALVPLGCSLLFRPGPRGEEARLVPAVASAVSALARVVSFDPAMILRAATADAARAVSAAVLAAAAMLVRPAVGVLYLLAVSLFLIRPGRASWQHALLVPPAVMLFAIVSFAGWSGVTHALFPLPLGYLALLSVALIGSAAALSDVRARWATGLVALLLFGALASLLGPFRPAPPPGQQIPVQRGSSATVDLPPNAGGISLIASGANVSGLRPGTVVGAVEVLDDEGRAYRRDLTIGDLADWGAFRSDQWFFTSNALPGDPGGRLDGYGWSAALKGSGRVRLRVNRPLSAITVTASKDLPMGALLHIDAVEVASR